MHGIAVGNPRAGNRTPRAEALAIGYGTLRYWTPQAAIGNRQGNTRRNIAEHRTDYGMHLLSDVATRGRR